MHIVHYHLPGLFEFYGFYKLFLSVFFKYREFFYEWCDIGSIYGAPADCLWGGGRAGFGDNLTDDILNLMNKYKISPRLTFSNSLLEKKHLSDKKCNEICRKFDAGAVNNCGVIVYSDLLLSYLKEHYPSFYYVSSTTKVLTDFNLLVNELERDEFLYVVPDFRLNGCYDKFNCLAAELKNKVEFLCNECCWSGCKDRKLCYENVSRKNLGEYCPDFVCSAPGGNKGYRFSEAMKNPGFIGINEILNIYLPAGFTNFKIEGRGLGSAILLEFLLYYMVKPECQLKVREMMYLDCMLDLF